jgi:hypothetical protein
MPPTFQRNPGPGLGLPLLRRVRKHLGKQHRRSTKRERLLGHWTDGLRKERAPVRDRREMLAPTQRLQLLDRHHAMVLPVHQAASRKARLRVPTQRKQRRDRRKTEQQQQRDGYWASHRGFDDHISSPHPAPGHSAD